MNFLVAGGTGFVGSELVERLLKDGHAVCVMSRRRGVSRDSQGETGVSYVSWTDTEALSAVERADAVVNLAGAGIIDARWSAARKAELRSSRVETTRALVDWIGRAKKKPACFISASAIGLYGPHGDEELHEDARPGQDFLAGICRAWEEAALAAARHGVRVVVIRIGIVLGRGGALGKMAPPFKFFAGGPIGSGRQWMSWIHVRDLVRLIEWAARTPSAQGPLNATAPKPVTMDAFAKGIGRSLGRPSWVPAPAFALKFLLGERADVILNGQRVVPRRAVHLGFDFDFPALGPALDDLLARK